MPKRRFEPVAIEAAPEGVEPTADLDELTADPEPMDHSTNGSLAVDDSLPNLSSIEWAAKIAEQESRCDNAKAALVEIEKRMGNARLQRALGNPAQYDALKQVYQLATEEVTDAQSTIEEMKVALFKAQQREEAAHKDRRTKDVRALVIEDIRDAVLFDDLMAQLGALCERVEKRNRALASYADVTMINSNRLNSESKYVASVFAAD